jgi:hypothetical protein
MPAGAFQTYESFVEYVEDGTIDLGTHTFNIALFSSTSNAGTLTHSVLADLTDQLSTANGYTSGGVALASVTANRVGRVLTFDAADATWTASGGSIVARFAVIYRTGTVNTVTDALVAVCLLDDTPADVTATDGSTLTVAFSVSGILTIGGGA